MDNPYRSPRDIHGSISDRRARAAWYVWLALNLVWGLLATFAVAFSAWLLVVLTGFGRGWLD